MVEFGDVIGLLGVGFVIGAYIWLQLKPDAARSIAYPALNAIGAGMIIVSLFYDWNLSAFLVESTWAVVSLFGLVRAVRARLGARMPVAA